MSNSVTLLDQQKQGKRHEVVIKESIEETLLSVYEEIW